MNNVKELIDKLLLTFPEGPPKGEGSGWLIPPLDVLDCVLSLNRSYDRFCLPRVERFQRQQPGIDSLAKLLSLIRSYSSPLEFSIHELDYNHQARAETLVGVLKFLLRVEGKYPGISEWDRLHAWANSASPSDYTSVGTRGFGLAGFQYLRILFGAQTVKPDVHIRRFVSDSVGHAVSDTDAIALLEQAGKQLEWRIADLDYAVWEMLARGGDLSSVEIYTYRLEVDDQTVQMEPVSDNDAVEYGRCLRAVLPAGTKVTYRCVQRDKNGNLYPRWPIPFPRDKAAVAERGKELARQYGLL